jgi:predicted CopG family antitoxin
MVKKLTITVEQDVYQGLHKVIGRGKISHFIGDLVRPHVVKPDLSAAYQQMAEDENREREAAEWSEGLIGDVAHETR